MNATKVLLVLSFISLASAQTTWNGLRFRMNEDDTKKQMSAQGFELREVEKTHYVASPHYSLKLPNIKPSFPFKVELGFDSSGLFLISMGLDTQKMIADSETRLSTLTVAMLAANNIHDALVVKYGKPIEESGVCSDVTVNQMYDSPRTVECKSKMERRRTTG